MDTIFLNSGNIKISDPHRLLFSLSDKIKLNRKIGMLLYQILAFTVHRKV